MIIEASWSIHLFLLVHVVHGSLFIAVVHAFDGLHFPSPGTVARPMSLSEYPIRKQRAAVLPLDTANKLQQPSEFYQ